jgi:hypothetical protein
MLGTLLMLVLAEHAARAPDAYETVKSVDEELLQDGGEDLPVHVVILAFEGVSP